MLTNYFKIAIAVLKRRKFFTFISLFGISFTLTILIVVAAFFDHLFRAGYPDVHRDRSLYVDRVILQTEEDWNITSPPSLYFLNQYVQQLKTPSKIAISSLARKTNIYVQNRKLSISYKYTNDQYWEVLAYQFIEGRPYNRQQVAGGERVAVLSEAARDKYFGKDAQVAGRFIEAENVRYRVIGVVKNVPVTLPHVYAEIYLPYTVARTHAASDHSLMGNYTAILLAGSEEDREEMGEEFRQMAAKIPLPGKEYRKMYTFADTYFTGYMRNLFGNGADSGLDTFYTVLSLILFLFLLLPTLNLVNINISRIMERSSEIGVRKAFGASSRTLVFQFIVENIILTFLGGLIGILLSVVLLSLFNSSGVIAGAHLLVNGSVLFYALLACLLFGFISGVYPAWRMSRIQVVSA
ncbi:MAG TPA: FtsX-like permease family protein, partial [Chitinophagaceae bacterium]|nr:FtsX-like permease family protein [Chitinophagaceae bacterium]